MSKHTDITPLPWMVRRGTVICDAKQTQKISSTSFYSDNGEANAAFIVKTVNAHDKLVKALEFYADLANYNNCYPDTAAFYDSGDKARQALKEVK